MSELFVTGITGLVGRAVAAALPAREASVTALTRGSAPAALPASIRTVEGDLEATDALRSALDGVRTVLHMAAVTGAASADAFRRVNVEGTGRLLETAAEAGVTRFIFVSSIAASFDDLDRYPYGASKRDAEALVRASELDWVIVRPTVVIGPGSAILERFAQLAALPISPLPGSGEPRIQPIAAEDLASCLVDLALADEPSGETIDIGGPGVVTLADFLRAVRVAKGKGAGPVIRLPLSPIRAVLTLAQGATGGRFPVSPAQLAMFEQDGVAEPHDFLLERHESFLDLPRMLTRSLDS